MLVHVEQGYASNGNHYHNHLHACDVLQTIHYFISETVAVVSTSENMTRTGFPVSIFSRKKTGERGDSFNLKKQSKAQRQEIFFLVG